MAKYTVSLLPGDGIGPEVAEATRRVIDATGVDIEWEICEAGLEAFEKHGELLPPATIESIRRNGVGLKAPLTTPIGTGCSGRSQIRAESTCTSAGSAGPTL